MNKKKILLGAIIVIPILSVLFSGSRTNPEIERQIEWDSPRTQALFYRACADCHSFETKWPWYSWFAPVSWFVIGHVDEGRDNFNISAMDLGNADEAASQVEEGDMPQHDYLRMHPEAVLSEEEKAALIDGLDRTFEGGGNGEEAENGDGDGDDRDGGEKTGGHEHDAKKGHD